MSIAIVVGTHGLASEQLIKTTEMILGQQKNVAYVSLLYGENTDTLVKKYTSCLKNLDVTEGVLFLVDTWGGSPFNAASQIVVDKKNYEIITGINIPMLIETFMARDENINFEKLVDIALKTGRIGIKPLKFKEKTQNTYNVPKINYNYITTKKSDKINNNKKNMNIILARIDDRLIHGQVATCWTKETNIERIIVINDEVSKNIIRKKLLTQVAPPGVTAHVIDINKAIRVYNNPKYANDRVMLLFTNPTDVVRLIENGIKINSVNIGGMAFIKGKTQINNTISVNQKDIEAFKKLHEYGIKLEIRKVPSDTPLNMIDLIKKTEKLIT